MYRVHCDCIDEADLKGLTFSGYDYGPHEQEIV